MTAIAEAPPRAREGSPVLRAFRSAPSGVAAITVVGFVVLVALLGPLLLGDSATERDLANSNQSPSVDHLLGTDQLGRDVLARLVVATRLSVSVGLAAAAIALIGGVLIGASAAMVKGSLRTIVLRTIDMMMSFPTILTAVFVSVIIGRGALGALIGVGVALAFNIARITSSLAISASRREYVDAARVLGVRPRRLLVRYVIGNISEPLLVAGSVVVGSCIVTISALSFLGLGVQAPSYDWGSMLTEGVKSIYLTPAAALGPAAAIAITALAFAFAGEALARAMNPRLWTPAAPKTKGPKTVSAASLESAAALMQARLPEAAGEAVTNGLGPGAKAMVLEVRDLEVSFPAKDRTVEPVKGVSFSVPAGTIMGIVGESGSGKTLTALAIAQLVPYPGRVSGSIKLHGTELTDLNAKQLTKELGSELAVVFQDPMASLNPRLTIGTQLMQAVRVHRHFSRAKAKEAAIEALGEVQIPTPERQLTRYPVHFSGGMRQRAMIAMGVMREPSLLLADEPTTALDVTIQAQIMDLLADVNTRHDTAIVLISHDLALVSQNCHRVLVMYAGRIVEELDATHLTEQALHPYTRALVGTVPEIEQARDAALAEIPGEAPDLASTPAGCPFHPRCAFAVERCATERPPLLRRPTGQRVACHVANADLE